MLQVEKGFRLDSSCRFNGERVKIDQDLILEVKLRKIYN